MRKLVLLSFLSALLYGCYPLQQVFVTASEADAKIYANGQLVGTGTASVSIQNGQTIRVNVVKEGFIEGTQNIVYNGVYNSFPPASLNFNLVPSATSTIITTTPTDAEIYANGEKIGVGTTTAKVPIGSTMVITVTKLGFFPLTYKLENKYGSPKPPATIKADLLVDDAYEASTVVDNANNDISINYSTNISEDEVWRRASRIVQDYFDIVEIADKDTFYLRTAWQSQTFTRNTVRTRFVIKAGGRNVLRIKLISEHSGATGTSIKADEYFKEWDRVLRKYTNIIDDFQNRLNTR